VKIHRKDGADVRAVLAAMIVDPVVLARIAASWSADAFGTDHTDPANVIGTLCVEHFRAYHQPPRQGIIALFNGWGESRKDQDHVALVAKALNNLFPADSDLTQPCDNPQLVIDAARSAFTRVAVRRAIRDADQLCEIGEYDKAFAALQQVRQIEVAAGHYVSITSHTATMAGHVGEDGADEDLVTFYGEAGTFWQGQTGRDCFVAILAPEKTGKSMDLVDFAVRAAEQRRKVAYFEVGDMTEKQVCRRFASRIAIHPRRLRGTSFPYAMPYPKAMKVIRVDGKTHAEVDYDHRHFDAPLSAEDTVRALDRFRLKKVRSHEDYIRLVCSPTGTTNVKKIESILQGWAYDGWTPDVVVIDYADILAPPSHATKMDERGQINETWKQLRALSQSLHCLLVTATQADAESYEKTLITRKNFSGDKRKLAHPTAMMAINITSEEKKQNVSRRNWIVMREGAYHPGEVCYAASCLAVCNPWVVSAR
jgi:hypothetical protein